jgi:hypothetical protein
MNHTASQEQIAAANAYENLHAPALVQQWAPKVVAAAGIGSGERVLDVACGTGVLARQAALHVDADGSVAGLTPILAYWPWRSGPPHRSIGGMEWPSRCLMKTIFSTQSSASSG